MDPPKLTVATIRYLFATEWLPPAGGEWEAAVPGGKVKALDAAANLAHTALWNLRRQGAFDFEQVRPVRNEPIVLLGGQSFSRFEFRDPGVDLRGLEGALIRAARKLAADGGADDEEARGMRRLVRALDLDYRTPWVTVLNFCLAEALAAELVEQKGWAIKRVEVVDPAAIESLRPRSDELRSARKADIEREPDLHHAVIADAIQAVHWAAVNRA